MFRRYPLFTLTVVLTLALGIGANTAIFTLVNSVLLHPLPFHDPARLVAIRDTYQPNLPKLGVSPLEYDEFSRQTDIFEEIARYRYVAGGKESNLTGGSEPRRVQATCVSSSLFPLLGIHPMLGRALQPADDSPNAPAIAMLSYRLWRDYFNANPHLIGAPIQLNGQAFTVIGILPQDLHLLQWADLWLPQGQAGDEITNPVRHSFGVIARLKPHVTQRQASSRLLSIGQRLEREHPKTSKGFDFKVSVLQEDLAGNLRPALLLLFGAVTLVLLIAGVNVANLMLSRAVARKREIAIRMALGASKWRIVRQSLAESTKLALAGGVAGLLLAYVALTFLLRLAPADLIDPTTIHLDATTLAFSLAVSLLTAIIFGVAPALEAARLDPAAALKEGGRSLTPAAGTLRNTLVIIEFALALVLLMGAGLLIHSFARVLNVNPGFQPSHVLSLRLQLSLSDYSDSQKLKGFYDRLETRLQSLPGIASVAATNAPPLATERANQMRFSVPESPLMRSDVYPVAQLHLVTPDYFRTLGISVRGRTYSPRDLDQPYIIVNETMARTFWPGQDAVGRRFVIGPWSPKPDYSTVIGVAADVKHVGLEDQRGNDFYFLWYGSSYLLIKTAGDPLALAPGIRREIHALDPTVAVSDFRSMEQVLDSSIGQRRFSTILLSVFAGVALILAVIGIYGIMSWSVAQRTQEIGIRMAVGADARGIFQLILGRGLKLAIAGLAIGLAATLGLTRVLATMLFEISPHDPWILAGASLLMLVVTMLACYLPARRATKVDPIATLRTE
jgi:putative ABC transport system permease protein